MDNLISDKLKNRIQKVGKHTLVMYLIQSLLVEIIIDRTLQLDKADPVLYKFVITPVFAIVALFVCFLLVKLLERSRITAVLLIGIFSSNKNIESGKIKKINV